MFRSFIWLLLVFSFLSKPGSLFGKKKDRVDLEVGDSSTCLVYADERLNKTGIWLAKDAVYQITAEGLWQDAGYDSTDANGFPGFTKAMKKGNFLKPLPSENYMKLIARLRGRKTAIGCENKITAHKRGRLIFTPNDAKFFFGNNHGVLKVTVLRVQ